MSTLAYSFFESRCGTPGVPRTALAKRTGSRQLERVPGGEPAQVPEQGRLPLQDGRRLDEQEGPEGEHQHDLAENAKRLEPASMELAAPNTVTCAGISYGDAELPVECHS